MEEQMTMIRGRLKEAQDRQKSYVNAHRVDRTYEVVDRVFLRVRPQKSSIRFGKRKKLSPRFVGPFEILEKKGTMAYRLALPPSLTRMHHVFHVFISRHYISDPSHVIEFGHFEFRTREQ